MRLEKMSEWILVATLLAVGANVCFQPVVAQQSAPGKQVQSQVGSDPKPTPDPIPDPKPPKPNPKPEPKPKS
ncbi:MAG: hypothetical protein JWN70_2841 [Planctomycetaceae bacterium]|nr:hypothetical protein [Planctomycetaceae bacterium]